MTTHTPGPWTFKAAHNRFVVKGINNAIVANIGTAVMEQIENTHLIAAAPDLLEALRRVMAEADFGDETLAAQCRAAITKAEG